jgi:ureidoacrylate peracid hydrolase
LILRSRGIDTVIIFGIATNVCCGTTAREAMVRDFRVLFMSDGTAAIGMGDLMAEELHKATLATPGTVFRQVLTLEVMIQSMRHAQVPSASGA